MNCWPSAKTPTCALLPSGRNISGVDSFARGCSVNHRLGQPRGEHIDIDAGDRTGKDPGNERQVADRAGDRIGRIA
jgi:hypothetical protein